ncbi:MAG: serine/threonine-protein kinase [Planctomycetota bacterium]
MSSPLFRDSHCSATPDPATAGPAPVAVIGPSIPGYRIIAETGRPANSTIYLATEEGAKGQVTIETVTGLPAASPAFKERFFDEARQAAAIRHPAMVRIIGVGEHTGLLYLVTEQVGGMTLYDILKREGRIPRLGATQVTLKLAEALHAAHRGGITHGDFKPSLVHIDAEGGIRIARLGVAKYFGESIKPDETVAVSPYTAPEIIVGNQAPEVRADIFALGALYFHMLLGRPPFAGTAARDLLISMYNGIRPVLANSDLPGYLCELFENMLAADREKRYANYVPVIGRLRGVQNRISLSARKD